MSEQLFTTFMRLLWGSIYQHFKREVHFLDQQKSDIDRF